MTLSAEGPTQDKAANKKNRCDDCVADPAFRAQHAPNVSASRILGTGSEGRGSQAAYQVNKENEARTAESQGSWPQP
jgi:hypothetical protein